MFLLYVTPAYTNKYKKRRITSDRKFVLRCVGKYQMTKAIFHVKCHGRWTIRSKKKGQITTKLIHNLQWIFLFSLWLVISRITTTLNAKGRLWPKNLFIFFYSFVISSRSYNWKFLFFLINFYLFVHFHIPFNIISW